MSRAALWLPCCEAAAVAQPSGKQNSFAAFSLPDFILVEVSDKNLPVSYANAFLKPARAYGEQDPDGRIRLSNWANTRNA